MKYIFSLFFIGTTGYINIFGMHSPENHDHWVKTIEFSDTSFLEVDAASSLPPNPMIFECARGCITAVEKLLKTGFDLEKVYLNYANRTSSYLSLIILTNQKFTCDGGTEREEYDHKKIVTLLLDKKVPLIWKQEEHCFIPRWLVNDHYKDDQHNHLSDIPLRYSAALSHPYSYVKEEEFHAYSEEMCTLFLIRKKLSSRSQLFSLGKLSNDIIKYVIGKTLSPKQKWAERGACLYKSLRNDSISLNRLLAHRKVAIDLKAATPLEIETFKKKYGTLYNKHCARLKLPNP